VEVKVVIHPRLRIRFGRIASLAQTAVRFRFSRDHLSVNLLNRREHKMVNSDTRLGRLETSVKQENCVVGSGSDVFMFAGAQIYLRESACHL
jgi:hypothetical protein